MSSGASPAALASSACGCSSCLAKSVAHVTSGGVRRVAPSCLTRRLGLAPARLRVFSRRLHPRIAASDFVGEYTSSSVLRFVAKPSNRIPAARSAQHLPLRPAPHLVLRLRLTLAPTPQPSISSLNPSISPRVSTRRAIRPPQEMTSARPGGHLCGGGARAGRRDLRLMERCRKRGRSPCFEHFVSEGRKMDGWPARPECDSVRNLWLHPEVFGKPRSG